MTVPGRSRSVLAGVVVNILLREEEAVLIARRTVGARRWVRVNTEVRPQPRAGSGMIPDRLEEFATTGKIVAPAGLGMTATLATQGLLRWDKTMPQRKAGLAILSNRAVDDMLRGVEAVMIARRTVEVHRWARVDMEVRPQPRAGSGMIPDRPEESATHGEIVATAGLGMTATLATQRHEIISYYGRRRYTSRGRGGHDR